jgi:steroid delta-isomerase-like uncharacterized protein
MKYERHRMTREEIVTFFNLRREAYSRLDPEGLAAYHAEDAVLESPVAGGTVIGRETIAKIYRGWFAGFPDVTVDWTDLLIDGDRAVQTATMSGTDTGGFMGLPPTGKRFCVPIVFLFTLKDGLIAHERRVYDFTGMLLQIGLLKAKPV